MADDVVIAVDIGGSAVKGGVFSQSYFESNRALLRTLPAVPMGGQNFESIRDAVLKAVAAGLENVKTRSLGISTTGSVNSEGILVSGPAQLVGYEMIDWSQILRQAFPSIERVSVVNDGKASAWGEYKCFAIADSSHVHFVLGTGVGSSVVVAGQLIVGDSGEAGFLGHTRVTDDSTIVCTCGRQGCIETVASGRGLVHEYNKLASKSLASFEDFRSALASKDPIAQDVLDKACDHFGSLVSVLANALNPANVTFGGGVVLGIKAALGELGDEDYFLRRVGERVAHCAFERSAKTTKLRYAALGNDGGLVGASLLAVDS